VSRAGRGTGLVAGFDNRVDAWFDQHLRGRPVADALMYAASAAGEHSMLWLAWAALRGWRAGQPGQYLVRATVALAGESALVNGGIKSLFRRQRPQGGQPHPLPLRTPRTTSFPSGHASAAFAAAALLGDGSRHKVVPYLAGATVAASRVHVRMHHASDVVAGAALGALLGEVMRRVVPLAGRGTGTRPLG
jgi:undecaprenyl-diphosphatase